MPRHKASSQLTYARPGNEPISTHALPHYDFPSRALQYPETNLQIVAPNQNAQIDLGFEFPDFDRDLPLTRVSISKTETARRFVWMKSTTYIFFGIFLRCLNFHLKFE